MIKEWIGNKEMSDYTVSPTILQYQMKQKHDLNSHLTAAWCCYCSKALSEIKLIAVYALYNANLKGNRCHANNALGKAGRGRGNSTLNIFLL